jgi:hypothetical protein
VVRLATELLEASNSAFSPSLVVPLFERAREIAGEPLEAREHDRLVRWVIESGIRRGWDSPVLSWQAGLDRLFSGFTFDGTDPDDLTRGEIEGRRRAMYALEALRRYTPGCENARLRNFGMTLGVRDTRKIDAAYNMTELDVREQGRFDDSIGIYPEFIDGYGILVLPTTGRYLQLPYRNILPKGVRNLLVAGRSSGGDRVAHAATRNMACCAVLGQGAGVAAAQSLHDGCDVEDVRVEAVQRVLEHQGVRIH